MLTVTDRDPNDGTYAEMAQYLLAALSEVMPGLRFKRLSSGLAADPADALRSKLPPSPRHLAEGIDQLEPSLRRVQLTNSLRVSRWQCGQKQASPSPTRTARIVVPQTTHGLPSPRAP